MFCIITYHITEYCVPATQNKLETSYFNSIKSIDYFKTSVLYVESMYNCIVLVLCAVLV